MVAESAERDDMGADGGGIPLDLPDTSAIPDSDIQVEDRLKILCSAIIENLFAVPESLVLEESLMTIATNPVVLGAFPSIDTSVRYYERVRMSDDVSEREYGMLKLYLALHGLGSEYSDEQKQRLKKLAGITNLPGGMMPVVAASVLIGPDMVSMDLGAGNGLQGLLMQCLCPHKKCVQVELSSHMIDVGLMFQEALNMPSERIEWVCGDIAAQPLTDLDFIYMYRPLKPYAEGAGIYESVARKLGHAGRDLIVLSVADCLGQYLGEACTEFYSNEFFTCYRCARDF